MIFRRALCLLLVPVLLANQAVACCAHTHIECESHDHETGPHIHLTGHSHSIKLPCRQHHHASASNACLDNDTDSNLEYRSSTPLDHDSDAIYLGEQLDVLHQSGKLAIENFSFPAIYALVQILDTRASEIGSQFQKFREAPFLARPCAIYLQHLSLLI